MKSLPDRKPNPRTHVNPLRLEELEPRVVLSASLDSFVGQPQLTAAPLAFTPFAAGGASGPYTPAQIRQAYGFSNVSYNGAGQTIAIVDAYADPTIQADLHHFDQTFGLADPALTIAQPGGATPANSGWDFEISLDVEWAHAIAPGAKILLVEAKSSSGTDLLNAVNYARYQPGVSVVSMSWGGGEFNGESAYDGYFTTPAGHAGITFVASSGDNGAAYGPSWPAISSDVLTVGGSSLTISANGTYGSETGWSGSGGGFSEYESRPAWQTTVGGAHRATPDVAYDANPNTGYYVYDTASGGSWYEVGGTSAGAPQWSALIALADQGRAAVGKGTLSNAQSLLYSLNASDFHDVVGGSNGYKATPGYDLVTGLGTPYADRLIHDLVALNVGVKSAAVHSVTTTQVLLKSNAGEGAGATAPPSENAVTFQQVVAQFVAASTTTAPVQNTQAADKVFVALADKLATSTTFSSKEPEAADLTTALDGDLWSTDGLLLSEDFVGGI